MRIPFVGEGTAEEQMPSANFGGSLWCLTTIQPQTAGGATLTEPTQAQHWIQQLKVEGFWFPFNTPHAESQHYPLTTTTKKDVYSNCKFSS